MAKLSTILVSAGLTVGGAILAYKLLNKTTDLSLMASKLDFDIKLNKPYFSGLTLIMPIDVTLSNPTKSEVTFEKPYIEIYFNDGTNNVKVAKSQLPANGKAETCTILAQQKSEVKGIKIEIPIISNFSTFKNIVTKLIDGIDLSSYTGMWNAPSLISANLDKLYPYFTVDVTVYVGNQSINHSFKLG